MWRFLVDEDLPRSTAITLRQAGYLAEDVRDVGLRGRSDDAVFAYAQEHGATLVTADKGFANPLRFAFDRAMGIILVRVPNALPSQRLNAELLRALAILADEELLGLLIVVEPGKVRVRRL